MKITNNLCLITQDGQTKTVNVSSEGLRLVVPEGKELNLSALVFDGTFSVRVVLAGAEAKCRLSCVYLSGRKSESKIRFDVQHQAGNTYSEQIVRGILTDRAKASFEGTIRIPKDSQKCDASQNHRAVVLSDTASVTAIPELEIYADDVKCAHGSAIGSLDKTQLFYLMSRGVPADVAKKMLLRAFVRDVLDDSFEKYVDEWMGEHV